MSTFERVSDWNKRANKLPEEVGTAAYWKSLEDQAERIKEELKEVYEAIAAKDISNLIKEGSDLDVVVSGFNYLAGSVYGTVIDKVLDNNDLKITRAKAKAENWLMFHQDNGVDAFIDEYTDENGNTWYSVKRKEDSKVLKYGNFPKVDISALVPQPVEEKYIIIKDPEQLEEAQDTYAYEVMSVESLEGEQVDMFRDLLDQHGDLLLTIVNGSLTSIDTLED